MGLGTCGKILCGLTTGLIGGAAVGAAGGAAAGATGAAILKAAGHAGYNVLKATQMTATGSAVFGGAGGMLSGALSACGLHKAAGSSGLVGFVAGQAIGGLIGYGIFVDAGLASMSLGRSAASAAVGAAVIGGSSLAIACAIGCCIVCTGGATALSFGMRR